MYPPVLYVAIVCAVTECKQNQECHLYTEKLHTDIEYQQSPECVFTCT